MENGNHRRIPGIALFLLVLAITSTPSANAAGTTLHNIREGLHPGFSRLVLECEGALPDATGPAERNSFSVRYADLAIDADIEKISGRLRGNVRQIKVQKEQSADRINFLFASPGAGIKSFVMKSGKASSAGYRLVIDVYPASGKAAAEKQKVAAAKAPAPPVPEPRQTPQESPRPKMASDAPAAAATMAAAPSPSVAPQAGSSRAAADVAATPHSAPKAGEDATQTTKAVQQNKAPEDSAWAHSGEASLILRAVDGEDDSSKFEEYRDISQPVAGEIAFEAEKDSRLYVQGQATGAGQDDPAARLKAGHYGKYDLDLSYDRQIHRYAYDARTLYSGIGSGTVTLDDALQTAVQNAGSSAAQATLLNNAVSGAATGDPDITRDRYKLGFKLPAFDPFTFKVEIGHEIRKGTRPYAGAFNVSEMVELFEPVDYETTDLKISGEYARKNVMLNMTYQFSQFTNNIDTLTFDNPLRAVDDAVAGSSSGQMDLAPDNQYHNLAFTGVWTRLPWNSQIAANAAWGMMMQDDKLAPFTVNSAIAAPSLPAASADAQVNTSLYSLRLTARPATFMRVKANLRYYDYDNRTKRINFSGGYVETDNFVDPTAITNLPTSYTKTRAGLDLGFDVSARTSLGIGYTFERTERENREVDQQDDNILKASVDTHALEWMDIRASFERTDRQIGDYNFDVYLLSGDDLNELPQMRKYDQADMVRDRYRLQATVYPMEPLALTGALTYGTDDFEDSPFGLQEDNHTIASFDAEYAVNQKVSVNVFYTYEKYENSQRGNDGAADWTADGEDLVNTVGGGIKLALIPSRLDFDLTYSYSDVDGTLSFTSPSGSFADFKAVDDTKLHALNSKLKYHFSKRLTLSLGYLWEKFEYDDYNKSGPYVPTNAGGNYQGALLSGTLPRDYDAHVVYTQLTFRYQ